MATYIKPDAVKDSSIAKSKLDTALANEINGKQEALTLTIKDNGNIVLANIQGQSKEFMPATPSGDPMHYAYVAAGAEYNDTGVDIVKTGIYGDTIIHKAGYWYLNELGDITNDEMRLIYLYANIDNSAKGIAKLLDGITTRTNIATWSGTYSSKIKDAQIFGYASNIITALLRDADVHYTDTNVSYMFVGCNKLEKVFPTIDATSTTAFNGAFETATNLKEIRLKNIKASVSFKISKLLSKSSILHMIQNEAATSAITITLHPDAYAKAMADADILAALEQHTNISLASA